MTVLVEYLAVDAVIGDPGDRFFGGLSAALPDLAKQGTALEMIERDEKLPQIRLSWLDQRWRTGIPTCGRSPRMALASRAGANSKDLSRRP